MKRDLRETETGNMDNHFKKHGRNNSARKIELDRDTQPGISEW